MNVFHSAKSIRQIFAERDWFFETVVLTFFLQDNDFHFKGITCDFSLPRGQREFIYLIFKNVEKYQRNIPKHKNGNQFGKTFEYFDTIDFKGTYETEKSIFKIRSEQIFDIKIIFAYNLFGDISFRFNDLEFYQKIGKGEKIANNTFEYHDIDTNEIFDFNNPFASEKLVFNLNVEKPHENF